MLTWCYFFSPKIKKIFHCFFKRYFWLPASVLSKFVSIRYLQIRINWPQPFFVFNNRNFIFFAWNLYFFLLYKHLIRLLNIIDFFLFLRNFLLKSFFQLFTLLYYSLLFFKLFFFSFLQLHLFSIFLFFNLLL